MLNLIVTCTKCGLKGMQHPNASGCVAVGPVLTKPNHGYSGFVSLSNPDAHDRTAGCTVCPKIAPSPATWICTQKCGQMCLLHALDHEKSRCTGSLMTAAPPQVLCWNCATVRYARTQLCVAFFRRLDSVCVCVCGCMCFQQSCMLQRSRMLVMVIPDPVRPRG